MQARLTIAHGALAAEAVLLEEIRELGRAAREDLSLLALPVRIVVPSSSLRLHVCERIASEIGATAGVLVQTLFGVAAEILARSGREARGGDGLVELWARRLAAREPELERAFGSFQDGYRGVAGTVRDLFDAGFELGHGEALCECIRSLALQTSERERALALVRTAERTLEAVADRPGAGRFALLAQASEALAEDPESALPARAVLVHGFADATGRAADLVEQLARQSAAHVLVDHPYAPPQLSDLNREEPAPARGVDPSASWTARLTERLEGSTGPARAASADAPAATPELELFSAPGAEAEAREVARRIHARLEAGARPERIGLVARELGPYRAVLRRHLERLGIPFSGLGTRAPLDGAGRRVLALAELCAERERLSADRWLDAVAKLFVKAKDPETEASALQPRSPTPELRLGLRVLGAARLGEVAQLNVARRLGDKQSFRLPVRTGVDTGRAKAEDEGSDRTEIGFHAPHARLGRALLESAVQAANKLVRRFERWPRSASFEEHLAELEKLCRTDLGWRKSNPDEARAEARTFGALARLADTLSNEELDRDEFTLLLQRAMQAEVGPPLGGQGGGVQVLSAMEARARTFDHLFLCGMNRDVFPRVGREDPLLSDDVRRALEALLPDIPIQARARDEDRYLFAQLLSASPRTTLSWQIADDDGKPLVASPLLERLLGSTPPSKLPKAPPTFPQDAAQLAALGPQTPYELAILGGLHGGLTGDQSLPESLRADYATRLDALLSAARSGSTGQRLVADARARVLDAFEQGPFEPERLAPWLGHLGPSETDPVRPDPRTQTQFITRFEAIARCPWQALLGRFLRIEESPDPLAALPGLQKNLLGNVVHGVLEELVNEALGNEQPAPDTYVEVQLADVLATSGAPVDWAGAAAAPEQLDALIETQAYRVLSPGRTPSFGLVRTYVEVALPLVRNALAVLAKEQASFAGTVALGAEVTAKAHSEALGAELRCRADLVQVREDKTLVLTDFKTGKVKSDKEFREKELPQGLALQVVGYALAADGLERKPSSRYLYLAADPSKKEVPDVGIFGASWTDRLPEFEHALAATAGAWNAGTFFPRFVDDKLEKPPQSCEYCAYRPACLHGDSGAKRALIGLIEREPRAELSAVFELARAGKQTERNSRAARGGAQ